MAIGGGSLRGNISVARGDVAVRPYLLIRGEAWIFAEVRQGRLSLGHKRSCCLRPTGVGEGVSPSLPLGVFAPMGRLSLTFPSALKSRTLGRRMPGKGCRGHTRHYGRGGIWQKGPTSKQRHPHGALRGKPSSARQTSGGTGGQEHTWPGRRPGRHKI